jgi:predicted alpha/beta superfamily hydrolase
MKSCLYLISLLFITINGYTQQSTASKNVSSFMLDAPQLKISKKIWVYLPYNYGTTTKKFPVVYMHDAQNLFDNATAYAGEWRIDETLDSLKAQAIVIAVEHGNEKRIGELTPYENEQYGGGNADAYLDFIVKTLKPYVDKNYRTKHSRANTVIFGSSLGGLASYYALLKYPDVFGKAGVFSPSLWFSNTIYQLTGSIQKVKGKLYIMAGDSESEQMVPDVERMKVLLNSKISKHNLFIKIVEGGKHNEALWGKEFAQAYLWLMD